MRAADWLVRIAVSEIDSPMRDGGNLAYERAKALLSGYVGERARTSGGDFSLEAYLAEGKDFFEMLGDQVAILRENQNMDQPWVQDKAFRRAVFSELDKIVRDARDIGLDAFLKALEEEWRETYAEEVIDS